MSEKKAQFDLVEKVQEESLAEGNNLLRQLEN